MIEVEWEDVQGPVLSGYGYLKYARYLFVRFPDGFDAHSWLETLQSKITTFPGGGVGRLTQAINLAFTWQGLKRLGYPEPLSARFPAELVSGMGDPERARRLGDTGSSSPDTWEIGKPKGDAIHALLLLRAERERELDTLEGDWTKGLELTSKQDGWMDPSDHREHFGFEDGISQPVPDASPKAQEAVVNTPEDVVPTGELVLGYPNAYGMFPATPTVPSALDACDLLPPVIHAAPAGRSPEESPEKDFGRNGTYLVFRKLEQNVGKFREFVNGDQLRAAKMVGRWPSGAPLTLHPDTDPGPEFSRNDFLYYNKDRNGFHCPAGSHVRRANPRDSIEHNPEQSLQTVSRHRILRRGVLFGERLPVGQADDGASRGLLFVCLNTDLRRQFEFIQQTWLNSPKFAGLSDERDPIVGANSEHSITDAENYNFTIPRDPVRKRLSGLPRFVTVKGGGYFFLPGITALKFLASLKQVGVENQLKGSLKSG